MIKERTSTVGELFSFLWERKLWWLMPIAVLLILLTLLLVLAQAAAMSPWMYPL